MPGRIKGLFSFLTRRKTDTEQPNQQTEESKSITESQEIEPPQEQQLKEQKDQSKEQKEQQKEQQPTNEQTKQVKPPRRASEPLKQIEKLVEPRRASEPAKPLRSSDPKKESAELRRVSTQTEPQTEFRRTSGPEPNEQPPLNTSFVQTKNHLVVDDSEINRYVIKNYLTRIGINVDEATNGKDCISKVMDKEINHYDIVWMDIRMPYMDGFEASSELRKLGYNRFIIGLTGHVEQESIIKGNKCGINKIVAKPIIKTEIYGLLDFLFRQKHQSYNQRPLSSKYADFEIQRLRGASK